MFKIIFKDKPDEIVEVTEASQLANTKVRVTPETSDQIQESLFKLGIQWRFSGIQVVWTSLPFLFIERRIIMSGDTESYFDMQPNREFEFISPLEEPQPSAETKHQRLDREFYQVFDNMTDEEFKAWKKGKESPQPSAEPGQEASQTTRPPLGLMPRWRWIELRVKDIKDAIGRYTEAGKEVPVEWVVDLQDLENELLFPKPPVSPEPPKTLNS